MSGRFTGFPEEAFDFYAGLEADNSREYWTRHKDVYERAVREPMAALADALGEEFGGPPKLFRPYRDVRFSGDKSPYKTHQGAFAEACAGIGHYVEINADELFAAAGIYAAAPDQLARYREAVDDERSGERLAAIVAELAGAGHEILGDRLKTRPRGVPEDHPRIELLRHRTLYAAARWPVAAWLGTPEAHARVVGAWRAMKPLVGWLAENVGPTERPRR
ncbi:DUF2461 domain-containing protein [Bailinhaonella thermotolerans]|uniref:DUF2461 domain-containing protein n=1 Tax=Bailinhaonella thermotolerans TaxID=1070861 RepID=A0A3A4AVP6_9ACTN|nr:DUF2461 domain-containing protein [Bailinhaonella thermotolerans]RJL32427.1 DUF2461 domain-containing protein [Bailinhaonella thermotolerans]